MKLGLKWTLIAATAAIAGASQALTFFNINVAGTAPVIKDWGTDIGTKFIDFNLPNGVVGDVVAPLRFGTAIITFEVTSTDAAIRLDQLKLFGLGGVAGTGEIFFNEVVEDMDVNPGGLLASANVHITNNNQLPFTADLPFKWNSHHIRVKKTVILSAPDNPNFNGDLAALLKLEQTMICVPEPGTYAALALGLGLVASRRRAKK